MSGAVREVRSGELEELLELYTHLHEKGTPPECPARAALWEKLLADPSYHIIVAERDGRLCASCTLVVVPNLTRDLRPYGLVENVVTRREYRKREIGRASCRERV